MCMGRVVHILYGCGIGPLIGVTNMNIREQNILQSFFKWENGRHPLGLQFSVVNDETSSGDEDYCYTILYAGSNQVVMSIEIGLDNEYVVVAYFLPGANAPYHLVATTSDEMFDITEDVA
jgi:hypothetical protein